MIEKHGAHRVIYKCSGLLEDRRFVRCGLCQALEHFLVRAEVVDAFRFA